MAANAIREPVLNAHQPQSQIGSRPALGGRGRVRAPTARLLERAPRIARQLRNRAGSVSAAMSGASPSVSSAASQSAAPAQGLQPLKRLRTRRGMHVQTLAALRIVAGKRDGWVATRISTVRGVGSSSVFRSALAAVAVERVRRRHDRDLVAAVIARQGQLRATDRVPARCESASSLRSGAEDEIRVLRACRPDDRRAFAARRTRAVRAEHELRDPQREHFSAGAARLVNQKRGGKALRSRQAPRSCGLLRFKPR